MFYIWLFHISYLEYVIDAEATLKKSQQGKVRVGTCISLHFKYFIAFSGLFSLEIQCYSCSQYSSRCISSLRLFLIFILRENGCRQFHFL